jgi:hypothetical protein
VEGCFAASACRTTSSFSTRPSLPVPSMSSICRLCSLTMCRTAGVARDACFPSCRCGFESSCVGFGGSGDACSGSGVSPIEAFVSFRPTSSPCSCGSACGASCFASLPNPSLRSASSAAEISLCMSMSTRGFGGQPLHRKTVHPRLTFPTLAMSSGS